MADARDQLAERRHLLGLHELHLRFLQVGQSAGELVGALRDALLQRFVELRELAVRAVDLAVAAVQAERDEADGEQQHDRIDREHQSRLVDARDGDPVQVLRCGSEARAVRDDRRVAELLELAADRVLLAQDRVDRAAQARDVVGHARRRAGRGRASRAGGAARTSWTDGRVPAKSSVPTTSWNVSAAARSRPRSRICWITRAPDSRMNATAAVYSV